MKDGIGGSPSAFERFAPIVAVLVVEKEVNVRNDWKDAAKGARKARAMRLWSTKHRSTGPQTHAWIVASHGVSPTAGNVSYCSSLSVSQHIHGLGPSHGRLRDRLRDILSICAVYPLLCGNTFTHGVTMLPPAHHPSRRCYCRPPKLHDCLPDQRFQVLSKAEAHPQLQDEVGIYLRIRLA
jgi:hypothetical protein